MGQAFLFAACQVALELSPNHFSSDTSRLLRVLDAALMKKIKAEAPPSDAGERRTA
jgi:hypothetical protein